VLGIVGRDGAHAELVRLPARNLVKVPDAVPDEEAVFVEPLAAACAIFDAVAMTPASRVAVIGDGKLGNLCAQVLRAAAVPVVAIGKHEDKLRLLSSRGVETVLLRDASELGRRFDVVVEASGAESGFDLALDLLEPRGTLVLKSTFFGRTAVAAARIVIDEIRVVGSRCGRFGPAIRLLEAGAIDVGSLVSERLSLGEAMRAMDLASKAGVLKVLLDRP
jgi:threonine dehydrogenase-like Zn-dependent dehydrogenase